MTNDAVGKGTSSIGAGRERERSSNAKVDLQKHTAAPSSTYITPESRQLTPSAIADAHRGTLAPSTPMNDTPRFSGLSPYDHTPSSQSCVPEDRCLPSRVVTDETLDQAYCDFILYCNPNFLLSTDLTELKKGFRTMPRSDGKAFSTWTLFELIRKMDQKEIKTWHQLALELGVEPPSLEKGQSTQKVQQYTVRLKRWMRAMHMDAFFEYLLGKQHSYFLRIPALHAPYPENGRDGVPLEEDLALRALDPKFRPKRGRRKTEDVDGEPDAGSTPEPKRPHLDTAVDFASEDAYGHPQSAFPRSAISMSAHPDNMDRFSHMRDAWSAVPTFSQTGNTPQLGKLLTPSSNGQQLNWRISRQDVTPSTPYPMSAVVPPTRNLFDDAFDEPRSAITPNPSKARARRRHGPAVSSAWSGAGGTLRGRPPSNRSVQDGPFLTFPANPAGKEQSALDMRGSAPAATPIMERASSDAGEHNRHFKFPPPDTLARSGPASHSHSQYAPPTRPERLQLQVPQHVGGPVHLITPTVLVNGQSEHGSDTSGQSSLAPQRQVSSHSFEESGTEDGGTNEVDQISVTSQLPVEKTTKNKASGGEAPQTFTHEDLKRALAADLLRADIVGRQRLRGPEAKSLAEAILKRIRPQFDTNSVSSEDVFYSNCASWLGLSRNVGITSGPVGSGKKIVVHRYRVGGDGYEVPVEDDEIVGNGGANETFDISWSLLLGGLSGEFQIKGLELSTRDGKGVDTDEDKLSDADGLGDGSCDSAADWKLKLRTLRERLRWKEAELQQLRDKVLEAVL